MRRGQPQRLTRVSACIRHGTERLFGTAPGAAEPGYTRPVVAKYVLAMVIAMFSATAWYGASMDLGFASDGAWTFARLLDQTFDDPVWSRRFGDYALLWPTLLAVEAGITDVPFLNAVFHFGLYLPFLVSILICWYASRGHGNDALLLFPLASYLLVVLPAASILTGTSHVAAVVVWPILFLLLRPRLTALDGLLLILLLGLAGRTYETAAASLGILSCLMAARVWAESPRSRPILLAAIVVAVAGIAVLAYWTAFPSSTLNRHRFVRGMFRSAREHTMLLFAAASLLLLAASLWVRRLRVLAFPAILIAALSITLPMWGRVTTAGDSFNMRSLTVTVLPILLVTAIAFHIHRPGISARQWMLAGVTFGLLTAGYAASWSEWRQYRRTFMALLDVPSGYVELEDTPLTRYRQGWPWTNPLMSILWSRDCVMTVVLNRPKVEFQPFDVYAHMPLQRHVAFAPVFAAASPDAARCEPSAVFDHRSAAAMLPPSTVRTAAVVRSARASERNARATSSAVTSWPSKFPARYSCSETFRAADRCLTISSVNRPERIRSAFTAFERMPTAP